MQNCKREGCHGEHHSGMGCQHGKGQGHCGQGQGKGKSCGNAQGCGSGLKKGNRRKLFEEKYAQYLLKNEMPSFDTDLKFEEWLLSDEGKKYSVDIEEIWKEVELAHPWGGKREFAGRRKTCAKKIPFNRRINEDVLHILKSYSERHEITETEALEKAIMLLEEL